MKHLLLRARKDPFQVVSPEESLERNTFGDNSGNLIFQAAAYKTLLRRDTTVTADRLVIDPGLADRINERYDAYVIPLANAFRRSYEASLIRTAQLIERLRIPVVVLGVGAQATVGYDASRIGPLEPAVRRFVTAVLDHGPSIGVRGEFTAAYLEDLGFRDVEVIGCPSMFLHGDTLSVAKGPASLGPDSPIAINVSPYVKAMGPVVRHHVERYRDLVYVPQDIESLERLLWGERPDPARADDPLPTHLDHPLLQGDRTRFFVDPWPWLEALGRREFVFGTRIHGNITALLAGTPSYVFAHDSRTLELARYFEIPHRRMADVAADVDAADLYLEADYGPLLRGHAARFATYTAYLARHGLRHGFEDGEDPDAFDARLRATPFPGAVTVRTDARSGDPVARLRRARRRFRRMTRTSKLRAVRGRVVRLLSRTGTSGMAG